ncbi:MAG: hypothetical protein OHK005_15270 [Candidatus Methylacidiphilales bacterium]
MTGPVNGVFNPDAGIGLGQQRGRHADQADASMPKGGSEANGIEKGTAADGDENGLAASTCIG